MQYRCNPIFNKNPPHIHVVGLGKELDFCCTIHKSENDFWCKMRRYENEHNCT